jgi:beta-glucosidase
VGIPAGATTSVSFTLPVADLARWDETSGRFVVEPGGYELQVGPSSAMLPLAARVEVVAAR